MNYLSMNNLFFLKVFVYLKKIMAKAILEYDLNDPDDLMAHTRAVKGLDMALALWEIAFNTKKGIEWQIESEKLDAYAVLDKIYEKFWEEMTERGLNLNNLVN